MLRLLTSTARTSSRQLSTKPNSPKDQRPLARRSISTKMEQIHHSIIGQDSVVENCAFYYIVSTVQASADKQEVLDKDSERKDQRNSDQTDGYFDAIIWMASVVIILFVSVREAKTRTRTLPGSLQSNDAEQGINAINKHQAHENISDWLTWISGSY